MVVLSAGLAVWWAIATLAARLLIVESPIMTADTTLVLSGAAVYSERLAYAGEIVRAGRSSKVLVTNDGVRRGWSRGAGRNLTSIDIATSVLADAGVESDRIEMLPGRVRSTYDEAEAAAAYSRTHAIQSMIVVTSPYHTRRARWVFERMLTPLGVRVTVEPAIPSPSSPSPATWWFDRRGWQMVAGEYVKFVYYELHYL